MIVVGKYKGAWNQATGQDLPLGDIYQSPGLISHVRKHHPGCVALVASVPSVLATPDYVGHNIKEPNSVELVKRLASNVMVCVKLDTINNYMYVATVFEITDAKLQRRIESGRLAKM